MKKIIFALVFLLAVATIVSLINYDPGYVLVSYGTLKIETNIWIALLALLALLVILSLLLRLLHMLFGVLRFVNFMEHIAVKKSEKYFTQGMLLLVAHKWDKAIRYLQIVARVKKQPLYYILASYVAYRGGQYAQAKQLLSCTPPKDKIGILLAADIEIATQNYVQALNYLKKWSGKNEYAVNKRLWHVYTQLEEWESLLNNLPKIFAATNSKILSYYAKAVTGIINALVSGRAHKKNKLSSIIQLWNGLPNIVHHHSVVINNYVSALIDLEDFKTARVLIERYLNKYSWDEKLVSKYNDVVHNNTSSLLSNAEKWLVNYPNSASLLLTLGKMCSQLELWGKAVEYLEKSFTISPSATTLLAYLDVYRHTHKNPEATQIMHTGLHKLAKLNTHLSVN